MSLPMELFKTIHKSSSQPKECPILSPIDLPIRCGPLLKLFNCDTTIVLSLMLVLEDHPQIPKVSYTCQNSSGEFLGRQFYQEQNFYFYRFDIDLPVLDTEQNVHYSIDGQTTEYWQFFIPSSEQSMNVVSYSCNGFSLACDASQYPSSLWYDVLAKHNKQHYHVMLGGGDQLYCDSIKLASKELQQWLELSHGHKKVKTPATNAFIEEVKDYYLNRYIAWFGQGFWKGKKSSCLESLFPIAQAMIPSINIYDDHDIIDGYGSYPDSTMNSPIFKTLGKLAFKYYMIFQHHQLPDEVVSYDQAWIKGKDTNNYMESTSRSIYSKLGKGIGLVGIDCRTERSLDTIVQSETYKSIFTRMKHELSNSPDIKHFLIMLGVPILYPRLVWLEKILTSPLLSPLKKLAAKGILAQGLVNEFDGGIEVLDDLNDHWCSKHHKAERNQLMKQFSDFGAESSVRITILSGDVHLCCIGRLKSKYYHHPTFHRIHHQDAETSNKNILEYPEYDPRLIFNVVSSAIVNAPPPDAMANLLDRRSKGHRFNKNCDEDMVPIFNVDPNGNPRQNVQFLNRRNWCDLIIASQSYHSNTLTTDSDTVDANNGSTPKFMPGSITNPTQYSKENAERYIKYPLLKDSLVTTLHVEADAKDFDAATVDYELLVPPLIGKYKLINDGIKHLH